MQNKASTRKSSGPKKSLAKKTPRDRTQKSHETQEELKTETDKEKRRDDLEGSEGNENQEYLNAENENKRFNKRLGMNGAATKKATVKTARINTDRKKRRNGEEVKSELEIEEEQSVEGEDSGKRKTRSQKKSTQKRAVTRGRDSEERSKRTKWIKERNGSNGHWRNRSSKFRVYNRNYERGFKDGYMAAMNELKGRVTKRHPSDGDFRYNERSTHGRMENRNKRYSDDYRMNGHSERENELMQREPRSYGKNMQEFGRERTSETTKGSRKKPLESRVHFEEHPTGRYFIEHVTGGSTSYNPKLADMHYRTKIDGLINRRGRKIAH